MKIWQIISLLLIAAAGSCYFASWYVQQQETIVVPVAHTVEDMARDKGLIVLNEDALCIKKSSQSVSEKELISIAETKRIPIRYTYQMEKIPFYPTVTKRYAVITPTETFLWDAERYEIQRITAPISSANYMPMIFGQYEIVCKKNLPATFTFDCIILPGIAFGIILLARKLIGSGE